MAVRNVKIKEWLWRYGPAEVLSLVTTLLGALIVYHMTGNHAGMAVGGTLAGNIGYFGTILIRDMRQTGKALAAAGRRYTFPVFLKNLRALFIEFGVAEIFDTLLIRPLLLYAIPQWTGSLTWGVIIAKFMADLTFYLPAILFYEWSKQRYRNF